MDFDRRLAAFYGSSEYWHYNMFNNFFFAGAEAKQRFHAFLNEGETEKCCLVTDPPFGCRTEPLAYTIQSLTTEYKQINGHLSLLPVFWIFPYYMENYVRGEMPQMEMMDYKINYTNHDTYHDGQKGRKQGSPVRIFTNASLHLIKLPASEGYRYCSKCKRSVDSVNVHCAICKRCPSKNGSNYRHCTLCAVCVKPNYKHCTTCNRCTQSDGHKCVEYQANLTCYICYEKGHNELNCTNWLNIAGRSLAKVKKLCMKANKKNRKLCLVCLKMGHNERMCAKRNELLNEERFLNVFANIVNSCE